MFKSRENKVYSGTWKATDLNLANADDQIERLIYSQVPLYRGPV